MGYLGLRDRDDHSTGLGHFLNRLVLWYDKRNKQNTRLTHPRQAGKQQMSHLSLDSVTIAMASTIFVGATSVESIEIVERLQLVAGRRVPVTVRSRSLGGNTVLNSPRQAPPVASPPLPTLPRPSLSALSRVPQPEMKVGTRRRGCFDDQRRGKAPRMIGMSDIKNEIRNRVLGIEGEVDFRLPGCGIDASPVLQQCLPLDDAKQIEGGLSVADASHVESPVAAASQLDILDDVRTTEGSPVADDSLVESPVAAASHLDILDDVPTTEGSPVADDSHVESPVAAASHLDILDEVPVDDDLDVAESPVAAASHSDILDEVPVDDDLAVVEPPVAVASHLDIHDGVPPNEGSPVADDSHVESPVAAASHLDILDDVTMTYTR